MRKCELKGEGLRGRVYGDESLGVFKSGKIISLHPRPLMPLHHRIDPYFGGKGLVISVPKAPFNGVTEWNMAIRAAVDRNMPFGLDWHGTRGVTPAKAQLASALH